MLYMFETDRANVEIPADKGRSIERYRREDADGSLILAEEEGAIRAAGVRQAKLLFDGGSHGSTGGPFLFHVAIWTPRDSRDELLDWYQSEHLPMLLEAENWDGCRFVEEDVPEGFLFHALHQLGDRRALDSQERKNSRATPWFRRLAKDDWFDTGFIRKLYRRT